MKDKGRGEGQRMRLGEMRSWGGKSNRKLGKGIKMRFERGCTELGRRAEQKLIFTTRTKTENGEEGQGDKTRLRQK